MHDIKIIFADLEVKIKKKQNSPTLCVEYKGKIVLLNTAQDDRPILMKEENAIGTY